MIIYIIHNIIIYGFHFTVTHVRSLNFVLSPYRQKKNKRASARNKHTRGAAAHAHNIIYRIVRFGYIHDMRIRIYIRIF